MKLSVSPTSINLQVDSRLATVSLSGSTGQVFIKYPTPEMFGGVADAQRNMDGTVTGTDNGPAVLACLQMFGECYFQTHCTDALQTGYTQQFSRAYGFDNPINISGMKSCKVIGAGRELVRLVKLTKNAVRSGFVFADWSGHDPFFYNTPGSPVSDLKFSGVTIDCNHAQRNVLPETGDTGPSVSRLGSCFLRLQTAQGCEWTDCAMANYGAMCGTGLHHPVSETFVATMNVGDGGIYLPGSTYWRMARGNRVENIWWMGPISPEDSLGNPNPPYNELTLICLSSDDSGTGTFTSGFSTYLANAMEVKDCRFTNLLYSTATPRTLHCITVGNGYLARIIGNKFESVSGVGIYSDNSPILGLEIAYNYGTISEAIQLIGNGTSPYRPTWFFETAIHHNVMWYDGAIFDSIIPYNYSAKPFQFILIGDTYNYGGVKANLGYYSALTAAGDGRVQQAGVEHCTIYENVFRSINSYGLVLGIIRLSGWDYSNAMWAVNIKQNILSRSYGLNVFAPIIPGVGGSIISNILINAFGSWWVKASDNINDSGDIVKIFAADSSEAVSESSQFWPKADGLISTNAKADPDGFFWLGSFYTNTQVNGTFGGNTAGDVAINVAGTWNFGIRPKSVTIDSVTIPVVDWTVSGGTTLSLTLASGIPNTVAAGHAVVVNCRKFHNDASSLHGTDSDNYSGSASLPGQYWRVNYTGSGDINLVLPRPSGVMDATPLDRLSGGNDLEVINYSASTINLYRAGPDGIPVNMSLTVGPSSIRRLMPVADDTYLSV